jgi:hypothetical protein
MYLFQKAFLLFTLNLLDGVLTLIWVRSGVAPESNQLMAKLLDIGNLPFLGVKIAMGAFAAIVLLHWGHRPLAKYGMTLVLAIYVGLMGIHMFTGLAALGISSNLMFDFLSDLPRQAFAAINYL